MEIPKPTHPSNPKKHLRKFFSRCLVNYSHLLNNWGACKYESFNHATVYIHTHRYSNTSLWGSGTKRTQPSHILTQSRFLLMNSWKVFYVLHFLFLAQWNEAVNVVKKTVWNYDFIACVSAQWGEQSQFHSLYSYIYSIYLIFAAFINEYGYWTEGGCSAHKVLWQIKPVEVQTW